MKARTLYKLIYRRDPPERMRMDYSVFAIPWKFIRKFISGSIAPFVPFNSVRILLYRLVGYKIGRKTFIGMHCYLDDRYPELIIIGNHVDISYCTKFAAHGIANMGKPIIIEDHAYVGMASVLVAGRLGITIGEGAIIGAGSVVTKSVPPWTLAVGNPARVIREMPRGTPDDPHRKADFLRRAEEQQAAGAETPPPEQGE